MDETLETNQRNADNFPSTKIAGGNPVRSVSSGRETLTMKTTNGNNGNDGATASDFQARRRAREAKRQAILEQMARLEKRLTQHNQQEKKEDRKRDTQLKIIAGAILLADVEAGNTARPQVVEMFKRGARRERDVKLLQEAGWL
jgi:hypothetical protein